MSFTYADNVESSTFLNPTEALGVEDNVCARGLILNDYLIVSFPSFTDVPKQVLVQIKAVSGIAEEIDVYVSNNNGSSFTLIGHLEVGEGFPTCASSYYCSADVTSYFDTLAKLNAAQIKLVHIPGGGGGGPPVLKWTSYVDAIRLMVYSVDPSRCLLGVGV